MNTILDLGTKHIRVLSSDKLGIRTMSVGLDIDDNFDLNSYLKSCKKALQSKKLAFLKNTIIDCLLPSSFFSYKVSCSDKPLNGYQIDEKSKKFYNFEIDLPLDIQKKINQIFSFSQIEIDYLGSSLTCDLQEALDSSKKDSDLHLLVNLSHSSLYVFIIQQGIILNYFQNASLCSKNLDSFLFQHKKTQCKINDKNPLFIFLPSIDVAQTQVKLFQQITPYLKKLLNFLHEIIHIQEKSLQQSIDSIYLSGGGFQFQNFPLFMQQMMQRKVVVFQNNLCNPNQSHLFSPSFHFYNRRKNGLT